VTVDEALAVARQILAHRRLSKIHELIFRQAWEGKSYSEIGRNGGYDPAYIKDEGYKLWQLLSQACEVKVTKNNFSTVLEQQAAAQRSSAPQRTHVDWGEAIDVSTFYGRTTELDTLSQWLLSERCRLVALLGIGGMGKTALSVKLAQQVKPEFDFLIWRSLRDAPPLTDLLTTLLQFLVTHQENLPDTEVGKLAHLLNVFRTARCLLILDNFESLFQPGERTGTYRHGYEGYKTLLQRLAEGQHQSCLVLTSREKPAVVGALQGDSLAVRVLHLSGLPQRAGQDLLEAKGLFGSETEMGALVRAYHGNPLALMITATSIQDVYGGKISGFLRQQAKVFSGVRDLLHQQIGRLSDLEIKIMYWLAINREPVSVEELQADIVPFVSPSQLVEALESLAWRSLIERNSDGFTQQPVIMEYMTEKLIEGMRQEIIQNNFSDVEDKPIEIDGSFLKYYSLLKTTAKDYIRESQIRLILQPLIEQTTATVGTQPLLIKQLRHRLTQLQRQHSTQPGYTGGNLINLLCHLRADFTDADLSGLTIWQADLTNVNLHRVNLTYADLSRSAFAETFGGVLSVTFSPDGQLLAIGDTSGCIQIWHIATGKQVQFINAHMAWLWAVVFSPDGQTLVSCSDDMSIKRWDVQTGHCLQVLTGTSISYTLAFSPDGQWFASGSGDGVIKLWQLNDRYSAQSDASYTRLQEHQGWIWSVAFSPDSQHLVSGSADQTIKLWDVTTASCIQTLQGHTDWVRAVAFSPNGQHLVSSSSDRSVKLWNVTSGQCLTTLQGHQDTVTAVAFHPNGQQVASASYDQTVKLWDLQSGDCLRTLQAHDNRVWALAFSPNGRQFVSGGDDHTARLWELRTGKCSKAWKGHTNAALSISFQATHSILASGHEDEMIRLWDVKTGQMLKVLRGHTNRIWSVTFAPSIQTSSKSNVAAIASESLFASGSGDRTIKLWNWQTEECLFTLRGHKSWIWSIAFSPDGTLLASSSVDGLTKLWDIHTGECVQTLKGHTSASVGVAFSEDSQKLARGGFDRTIKIWDVRTGECLQMLEGHQNSVWSVLFLSDTQLVSSSYDHTIKVWDLASGNCTRTLQGHRAPVLGLSLSVDGQHLASSSLDQTVKIWNVETGNCVQTLTGHRGIVASVLFCPDDHRNLSRHSLSELLISSSLDETIKLWDIQTGTCLQTLHPPRPYEKMNILGVTGLTEAQKATLKALGAHE
jgi:WD40 repeat protein